MHEASSDFQGPFTFLCFRFRKAIIICTENGWSAIRNAFGMSTQRIRLSILRKWRDLCLYDNEMIEFSKNYHLGNHFPKDIFLVTLNFCFCLKRPKRIQTHWKDSSRTHIRSFATVGWDIVNFYRTNENAIRSELKRSSVQTPFNWETWMRILSSE